MSDCQPCCEQEACDPSKEPLASALNNFIVAFFGSLTKTCVGDQIVWTLPCNLDAGITGYPRVAGEGVACYLSRVMGLIIAGGAPYNPIPGVSGYTATVLTNTDVNLVYRTQTIEQIASGTLTGPVSYICKTASGSPVAGAEFWIYVDGLVTSGANVLTIKSEAATLYVIEPGIITGWFKVKYTGSAWKLIGQYYEVK